MLVLHGNIKNKTLFFIQKIIVLLSNLCSNYTPFLKQISVTYFSPLKYKYPNTPIGRKYKHQISRATTPPPCEEEPLWLAKTPVIGMIRQLKKNMPWISNKYLRALSFLFWALIVKPIKKVDKAMMA